MQKLVLLLISAYRYLVSPFLAAHCRYYPTCSEYAQTAIQRFGLIKGGWMSTKRICRCHPWHEGGVDPVPSAQSEQPACSLHSTATSGKNKHG